MTDPIADLIGDYRAFTALQRDRLAARGIDIAPYELSHLAVRVPEWDQYVHLRTLLERHAVANLENVWNGRPISLILLAEPLRRPRRPGRPAHRAHPTRPPARLQDGPGAPRRGRRRGGRRLLPPAPGSPDRPAVPEPDEHEPYYVLFEDFTHVKFYRRSLRAAVELEGGTFDGVPPRRRLGPAAAGHGDRPEPAAPVNEPPGAPALLGAGGQRIEADGGHG